MECSEFDDRLTRRDGLGVATNKVIKNKGFHSVNGNRVEG